MHAAMHANSSSSLAHIERKHKRSSLAWFRSNDCVVSSLSSFLDALSRFSFDKVEMPRNEAASTPFVVTSKDIRCVDILRTIAKLGSYPQFNCINTRASTTRSEIRHKYIKSEEYNTRARGSSLFLHMYDSIKFAELEKQSSPR